jgi:hypothetical protein
MGHKLQLLALLTFLEGERRNKAMVANSSSGTKGSCNNRSYNQR